MASIEQSEPDTSAGPGHGPKRPAIALQEGSERRLRAYALAAGAAGVGMLALAQPAKAEIIYYPGSSALSGGTISFSGTEFSQRVGFDHCGLLIGYSWACQTSYLYVRAGEPRGTGGVLVGPLKAGAHIGPSQGFTTASFGNRIASARQVVHSYRTSGGQSVLRVFSTVGGPWANVKNGYMGLRFLIGNNGAPEIAYGWARLTVNAVHGNVSWSLDGAAYDTVAGQPIVAGQTVVPEPGTLGLLALGWLGLGFWRRKKQESEVRSQESE